MTFHYIWKKIIYVCKSDCITPIFNIALKHFWAYIMVKHLLMANIIISNMHQFMCVLFPIKLILFYTKCETFFVSFFLKINYLRYICIILWPSFTLNKNSYSANLCTIPINREKFMVNSCKSFRRKD